MAAVQSICEKTILMKNGSIESFENTKITLNKYLSRNDLNSSSLILNDTPRYNTGKARFVKIEIFNISDNQTSIFFLNEPIKFKIELETYEFLKNVLVDLEIFSVDRILLAHSVNYVDSDILYDFDIGKHLVSLIMENIYQPGNYYFSLGMHFAIHGTPTIDYLEEIGHFQVLDLEESSKNEKTAHFKHGFVRSKSNWMKSIKL
jgi:hypothetical protein